MDKHADHLDQWAAALRADGSTPYRVRDRVLYVRAIAQHAGKTPDQLTDRDLSAYAKDRGLKASTVEHYRAAINAHRRWITTGITTLRLSGQISVSDMAPYIEWLRAGKYRTGSQTARRMSPDGARAHAAHVQSLAREYKIHPTLLTAMHVEGWLTSHESRCPKYKNRCLRAVRYYSQFADVEDPTADIRRFSEGGQEPKPRPADAACIAALLTHPNPFVIAMTVLGASAGLRRHEISKIRAEDFIRRNGRWRLTVHGKGGKTRVIVMGNKSMQRMSPVFIPSVTRGRLFPHLSDDPTKGGCQVGDALSSAAAEYGYTMTAHQLRHYAATTLYEATRDIEAVRRILGHSSVDTTMRYIRAWSDDKANDSADALDAALDGLVTHAHAEGMAA